MLWRCHAENPQHAPVNENNVAKGGVVPAASDGAEKVFLQCDAVGFD